MNWASVHLRNKVGREDVNRNRLVLVWVYGDRGFLVFFLYQFNLSFPQSNKINRQFLWQKATRSELFGALLLFSFFCLQGLEQPENCPNDRSAGMAGKLKWPESRNDRKVRATKKPQRPDWFMRQYIDETTVHLLNGSILVLDHFDRWIFAIWTCGFCVKPISVFACYSRINRRLLLQ